MIKISHKFRYDELMEVNQFLIRTVQRSHTISPHDSSRVVLILLERITGKLAARLLYRFEGAKSFIFSQEEFLSMRCAWCWAQGSYRESAPFLWAVMDGFLDKGGSKL